MRYLLIFILAFTIASTTQAAEPIPGDACTTAGATIASNNSGIGHFMVCQSSTWKSVYSYSAAGALTKIGNLTCATNEILKFNGTNWACAADAGLTALPALSSANIWVGSALNAATAVTMSGDATLSNAGVLTIASGAVTSAEILDSTITGADIANTTITIGKISATGTAGSTTYLRGDGSWSTPSAGAAGSSTEVQFRNSSTGALAADTNLTWSSSTGTLSMTSSGTYGIQASSTSSSASYVAYFTKSGSGGGAAVVGSVNNTSSGGSGVSGMSNGTGAGVFGSANHTTSFNADGVYGRSYSSSGHGVYGTNLSSSGTTYGVYGQASSASGYGVFCNGTLCGGVTTWTSTSDQRLKTKIHTLGHKDGLDSVIKLRPVKFHWKDVNRDRAEGEQLGFIAQEVEKIYPEIVDTAGTTTIDLGGGKSETVSNTKVIGYSELVVPLVKAVQELKEITDNQTREIQALHKELQAVNR